MQPKYWLLTLGGLFAAIVCSSLLVASASFTYKHPRAPGMQFKVGSDGMARLEIKPEAKDAFHRAAQKQPYTVVRNAHFDFGEMNPQSVGEHLFEIRNAGEGPLTLKDGGSTCKCTAAEIRERIIPPGGTGSVLVSWNTGSENDPAYAHHVVLETNDPKRPEVRLSISGRVSQVCAAQPAAAVFPSLKPTQCGRSEVLVYSTTWNGFDIESVHNSLEHVSWETRPATSEELAETNAKSGQWVTVIAQPQMPAGEFGGQLTLSVRPHGGQSQAIELPIEVSGRKLGRFSIIGPEIDDRGSVQLGPIVLRDEKVCRLLLRYRGESESEIPLRVESDIPYVKGIVIPSKRNASGLFDLEICVSQEAPLCNHMHPNAAQLYLISDHPDDPQMTLRVEFAVIRP